MTEVPLDDRSFQVERVLTQARAFAADAGDNLEALCLIAMRKDPMGTACEFAGRPFAALAALCQLAFELLQKIEPDASKRAELVKRPLGDVLVQLAQLEDQR